MRVVYTLIIIISCLNIHISAASQTRPWQRAGINNDVQIAYTGFFNHGYNHLIEIGYYRAVDAVWVSYGPSISIAAQIGPGGKVSLGPQIGYEFNVLFFDARLDARYIHQGFYIHPAVGFSLLGGVGISTGYNVCLNQKDASGFTLGVYVNINKLSQIK